MSTWIKCSRKDFHFHFVDLGKDTKVLKAELSSLTTGEVLSNTIEYNAQAVILE